MLAFIGQLIQHLVDLGAGELIDRSLQNGVGLHLVKVKAALQRFRGVGLAVALPNDGQDLVQRVENGFEPGQDMKTVLQNAQIIGKPAFDRFKAKVNELLKNVFQVQALRSRGRRSRRGGQTREIDGEIMLKRRVFEEIRHGQVGVGVRLEFQHDSNVSRGFVADVNQLRDFFCGNDFTDALDDRGFIHGKGDGENNDVGFPSRLRDNGEFSAHANRTLAGFINRPNLGAGVQNFPSRGEIRAFDRFQEIGHGNRAVVDQGHCGVNHFPEIMRGDVGGHAHGDAGGPVDEEIGKPGGQHKRFFGFAVVICLKVNRVFFKFIQQFQRDGGESGFGVSIGRGRVAVQAPEVAVSIHEGSTE